jgi:hypothetical protein
MRAVVSPPAKTSAMYHSPEGFLVSSEILNHWAEEASNWEQGDVPQEAM